MSAIIAKNGEGSPRPHDKAYRLPRTTVAVLQQWFAAHRDLPYPDNHELVSENSFTQAVTPAAALCSGTNPHVHGFDFKANQLIGIHGYPTEHDHYTSQTVVCQCQTAISSPCQDQHQGERYSLLVTAGWLLPFGAI